MICCVRTGSKDATGQYHWLSVALATFGSRFEIRVHVALDVSENTFCDTSFDGLLLCALDF